MMSVVPVDTFVPDLVFFANEEYAGTPHNYLVPKREKFNLVLNIQFLILISLSCLSLVQDEPSK